MEISMGGKPPASCSSRIREPDESDLPHLVVRAVSEALKEIIWLSSPE